MANLQGRKLEHGNPHTIMAGQCSGAWNSCRFLMKLQLLLYLCTGILSALDPSRSEDSKNLAGTWTKPSLGYTRFNVLPSQRIGAVDQTTAYLPSRINTMNTLRTLVVGPNLPYPTLFGVDLRNWQNLNGLLNVSQVGVFGLCSNDPRRKRVPHPALACWHTSTDPALTYPLPQGQKVMARAWLFNPMGHPSDLYYSDAAAAEIAALVEELRPQVVVLEGLWLYRYIDLFKSYRCRIVLDCHNVEAPLSQQIADTTSGN